MTNFRMIASCVALIAFLSAPLHVAHAGDDISNIEREVASNILSVARSLSSFEDAKDESPLQMMRRLLGSTSKHVHDWENALNENKTVIGMANYTKSKKVVDSYEVYLETLSSKVTPALVTLKKAQFSLARLEETCKKHEIDQNALIAKYIREKDTDGIEELPKIYEKVGREIGLSLKQAEGMQGTLQKAFNSVKSFDPVGREWDIVEREVEDSAQKILGYWVNALRSVHKECDELAKGDKDKDIVDGVEELEDIQEENTSASGLLLKQAKEWREQTRGVIRQDCESMEKIWQAYCGTDWEPHDEDGDTARALANQLGNDMKSKIIPIKKRGEDLKAELKKLEDSEDTKRDRDRITKIIEKYGAQIKRISDAKDGGAIKGAAHPISQFATHFGKEQHKRLEGTYGCDVADVKFPNAPGRPDCIVFKKNSCKVYEFKPDNAPQKSKGAKQTHGYLKSVTDYYQDHFDDNAKSADIGGDGYKVCVENGKVEFDGKLAVYKMCHNTYTCGDWK